jgi:site-specific DNA recombinase
MLPAGSRGEFGGIIAESIDRVGRNRKDFGNASTAWVDNGIGLRTVHGDDSKRDGWMVIGIKVQSAEQYRREIAQRTRRGLTGVAEQKRNPGSAAYGYAKVEGQKGKLVIAPE